jgi:hypothetical protein
MYVNNLFRGGCKMKNRCGHAFAPNCDECYEWAKEYITRQDKEISELQEEIKKLEGEG